MTDRNCKECVHHSSGSCSKWQCFGTVTINDVKRNTLKEISEKVADEKTLKIIGTMMEELIWLVIHLQKRDLQIGGEKMSEAEIYDDICSKMTREILEDEEISDLLDEFESRVELGRENFGELILEGEEIEDFAKLLKVLREFWEGER